MRRKTFFIATLFLFFVICLAHSSSHGKETSLTLVYSSNTMGEVDPSC